MESIRRDNAFHLELKKKQKDCFELLTKSECPICKVSYNHFTSKFVFFVCSHGICFDCLLSYVSTTCADKNRWPCPMCRNISFNFCAFNRDLRPQIYYTFLYKNHFFNNNEIEQLEFTINQNINLVAQIKNISTSNCQQDCNRSFNHYQEDFIFLQCGHGTCLDCLAKKIKIKGIMWNCNVCKQNSVVYTIFHKERKRPVIYYTAQENETLNKIADIQKENEDPIYKPPKKIKLDDNPSDYNTRSVSCICILFLKS